MRKSFFQNRPQKAATIAGNGCANFRLMEAVPCLLR